MLKLVTPPAVEPLTVAEARAQCGLSSDVTAWDDWLTAKIAAARRVCENHVKRSFVDTTWDLKLCGFPTRSGYPGGRWDRVPERLAFGRIRVPIASLRSVTSISYLDTAGVSTTLDPSAYQVVDGAPGSIIPAYGTAWPAHRVYDESVTVRLVAGYGPTAGDVPENAKHAILLLVAHYFEHREADQPPMPDVVQNLLNPEEWGSYGG